MGGVGGAWPSRGLPQLLGVFALGFHTPGHSLHPSVHHRHPPISVHPLPPRVQAQEPAEGSLFQQPVGRCKENSGNNLGWTWSYMARCVFVKGTVRVVSSLYKCIYDEHREECL